MQQTTKNVIPVNVAFHTGQPSLAGDMVSTSSMKNMCEMC